MHECSNEIHRVFVRTGHRWRFTGSDGEPFYTTPSLEDIDKCLTTWEDHLEKNGGGRIESGGIVMEQYTDGAVDVFVYVGTINKENEDA